MRVIAGRFKGHQLVAFKGPQIRPTTDRVKETVFNKLMHDVPGARVLDLFAGTGNLSIESLSRGANCVDAVESHPSSVQVIRANLKKIGVEKDIRLFHQDVFKYLKTYRGDPYDVVLIDPPFTKKLAHEVMSAVQLSVVCRPETTIVIEASVHERVDERYGEIRQYDQRHFGDKIVFFFVVEDTD